MRVEDVGREIGTNYRVGRGGRIASAEAIKVRPAGMVREDEDRIAKDKKASERMAASTRVGEDHGIIRDSNWWVGVVGLQCERRKKAVGVVELLLPSWPGKNNRQSAEPTQGDIHMAATRRLFDTSPSRITRQRPTRLFA